MPDCRRRPATADGDADRAVVLLQGIGPRVDFAEDDYAGVGDGLAVVVIEERPSAETQPETTEIVDQRGEGTVFRAWPSG
jgi:hypothetical protein